MRRIVVVALVAWARSAGAEPADALQAEGETDAKLGDYAGAIEKFKAADRIERRASHACLIALAYTRRNLWPQAEIFRSECHERAKPGDPLPDWMAAADDQIDRAIAIASVAAVTIDVAPDTPDALLTVSSFALDEQFRPRVVHLPFGTHQIFARARGVEGHELVVVTDKTPQHVVVKLHPPEHTRSVVPWIVVGAGVTIAAIGGVLDATWYKDRADRVRADYIETAGPDLASWRSARDVVIGCYVAGAIGVGVGLVLRHTMFEQATITVAPRDGGGVVSIGWTR